MSNKLAEQKLCWAKCFKCDGTGRIDPIGAGIFAHKELCDLCHGSGLHFSLSAYWTKKVLFPGGSST